MDARFGYLTRETISLFTDLYELTMLRGYRETGHVPETTFDLFFRDLPPHRGYVVAAGLEQVVHYVQRCSFGERAIGYLRDEGFEEEFLEYLADWEFTGDVRVVPEGTAVFPDEPLLEVTAPIDQAQLFETMLINQVGFQSLIATKAARMRDAVNRHDGERSLVDFGSRRAHGTDAGIKAARAAYVGGFDGTSNVAAGEAFGVPIFGTMAHSWVQSFPSERAAFEAFVDVYGEDTILLVDTYDTVEGARLAADVADERGVDINGIRLDSGDLIGLSKEVAPIVDDMNVYISSGVDEYFIDEFLASGGVGDGFGPGTSLVTSADAPKMEGVYKLVAVEEDGELQPSMKLSAGKVTYPGRKRIGRVVEDGTVAYDVLGLAGEDGPGEDILVDVFEDGELVYDLPDLDAIRDRTADTLASLPADVRTFEDPSPVEVRVSEGLQTTTEETKAKLETHH